MQSEEFDVVNNDSRLPTDQSNTEEQDEFVKNKIEFINRYKKSSNTANSTIDDNSSMV